MKTSDKTTPVTASTAILGFVSAVLALAQAFGLGLTADQLTAILGVVGTGIVLAAYLWRLWGIARSRVVEETPDGRTVLAGPANELPTGSVVRDNLGDLEPSTSSPRRAAEA